MNCPTVSVVIPAYNQAVYVEQAIRSVLDQSYDDLELVVVNDASPDATDEVVRRFGDPRLVYVVHRENRGLPAARNTGIQASRGPLVAFLDADDYFDRDKLAAHVDLLTRRPDVGVSYAWRFNLNCSKATVREMWQPPLDCALADLIGGFPFAPSDMVVRRTWLEAVGSFDETLVDMSEDLDINCRLALAGCRMAGIDRALTYRRYHAGRHLNIARRYAAAAKVLDAVLADPRCPAAVRAFGAGAHAAHARAWALQALVQGETDVGQRLLRVSVAADPSQLRGQPSPLMRAAMQAAIADESQEHEAVLTAILDQCPAEIQDIRRDSEWAVGHGYLQRAVRASLWERPDDASRLFQCAAQWRATVDDRVIQDMTYHLLGLERQYGRHASERALARLRAGVVVVSGRRAGRSLVSCHAINRAYRSDRESRPQEVLAMVGAAVVANPRYAADRGVLSLVARSLLRGRTGRRGESPPSSGDGPPSTRPHAVR